MSEAVKPHKVVLKITPDLDPREVLCTTYQMRNMFDEIGMGHFGSGDIMNLMQHINILKGLSGGDRVLDVCCGRGLALPLLKYHHPNIQAYVGVDIHRPNMDEARRSSGTVDIRTKRLATNSPGSDQPYYPFQVHFVQSNVADMSKAIISQTKFSNFHRILYTSAIEHMQKDAAIKSLRECFALLKSGGQMFLSSPNTDGLPYETQYAAHLYEWPMDELIEECEKVGFQIEMVYGLLAKSSGYADRVRKHAPERYALFEELQAKLDRVLFLAIMPMLVDPELADEVMIVCRKP